MKTMNRTSRRGFFETTSVGLAPWIVPATALGRNGTAPSERIHFGVVGLGGRGMYLLHQLLASTQTHVVAICDVHEAHYRDNPWGKGVKMGRVGGREMVAKSYGKRGESLRVTDDFREICGSEDVDAVLVATPDHWHALCTLQAIRDGKDVYCEKPVSHTFAEGKAIRAALAQAEAVFQTGSQQRSDPLFRQAVEIVLNGHLGKLQRIEVGLPPGYSEPQGDDTIVAPPNGLDYERWCGPARKLPYMRARHHRWWRGHRAYGGGVLMDWIGHHNDIAHWSMDADNSGPLRVEAVDWQFPQTAVYDTPQSYRINCQYDDDVQLVISSENALGTKWMGEDGWLYVDRGKLLASDERWLKKDFQPGSRTVLASPGHLEDFLNCVRNRGTCVAPAETAHRSITPGFLGYVSHRLKRPLKWDAVRERVVDDEEANTLLLQNPYRTPWTTTG